MTAAHPRNNFDFLRIVAAVMVVFAHSYALTARMGEEPLVRFTGLEDFGSLGVSIFFVISGFLVTGSYMRRPNLPVFLGNRALRLLPALAVVVLVSAFVLGPLTTSLGKGAYLTSAKTWFYPLRNVLIYPVDYVLPGVFDANPYPHIVNGALWTLRLEVSFYLAIAVLGWRQLLTLRTLSVLSVLLGLAYEVLVFAGPSVPAQALIFCRMGLLFFLGATASAWRGDERWGDRTTWIGGGVALVVLVAAAGFKPWAMAALPLCLPPLVLVFALTPLPGIASWGRIGDLSYGLYLSAFPIQQMLVRAQGRALSPLALAFECLAIALPLAVLSWWLIERPALGLKTWLHERLVRFDAEPMTRGEVFGSNKGGLVPLTPDPERAPSREP